MSMDQQMTSSPVDSTTQQVPVQNQQTPQQMSVIQEQAAPMETQDQLMTAPANFTNAANNASNNLQHLNGNSSSSSNNNNNNNGASQNQYAVQPDSSMQQYKVHTNHSNKDTNQNFVDDTMDLYGTRYQQTMQQQQQQLNGLTGTDPMLNSVAMIQNGPITYPRKITRSMHQQNLIQLQQGMNGNETDFKMELKCEPDNGF